ncbi:MAG: GNAT family N-acetyltransferase, partial [Alphaproteobacteria bacterium]
EILIREAEDGDSDAVIALIDLCWSAYPGVVLDVDLEEPGLRRPASHFRERDGAFWTAWSGTALAGVVGYTFDAAAGEAELHKLYVHPDQRRSGLGRQLTALVEETVRGLGARRITLWSDTRFETAHRFYRGLGYAQADDVRALGDISNSYEYHFVKAL